VRPERSLGAAGDLTAGSLLRRNVVLNLLGQALPLLVAIVAIPPLVEGIGVERFGLLALAWLVIGYFSMFDLGIGRALTQLVSERIGEGREEEVARIAWAGLVIMTGVGVVAWGALHLLAPALVTGLLNVPPELREEAVGGLRILAVAVPFVVSGAGLRGLLEASQRFGSVNAVRIPLGAVMFVGPWAVLPFSADLRPIVGALTLARIAGWVGYALLLRRAVPSLRASRSMESGSVRPLLRFGGWITVSNVVSPLMVHLDRVVIASMLSMAAVAYYATPFEVVTRLWIVPAAVVGVLFPAFAVTFSSDPARTARLFERATGGVLVVLIPMVVLVMGLAAPGLELWVGRDFAREGTAVAQWLALGVFVNSLAQVPYALVQAVGRPDVTAKLHLLEAPLYFLLLWGLLGKYGLPGAAMAWTIRVALDAVLLFGLAARLLPACKDAVARLGVRIVPALGILAAAAIPVQGAFPRTTLLVGLLAASLAMGWFGFLDGPQRLGVVSWLRSRRAAVLFVALGWVAAGTLPLGAQERGQAQVVSSMGLRGEEASYLRLLQIRGSVPLHPWGIRSFGPRERERLVPVPDSAHVWQGSIGGRIALGRERLSVWLGWVEARGLYQSAFPMNWQSGAIWAGRGLSGDLTASGEARLGPVTLRLSPTLWGTANNSFPLMRHPRSDELPYADPRHPVNIDFPQRFGDRPVGGLGLGESELRVDVVGLAAGVSTAPIAWGAGDVFSLLLSGRGVGFSHVFVGTSQPLDLRVLRLHVRGAWGELEQSDQAPWEGLDSRRFVSSLAVSLTPAPLPGLELGLGRFFHIPWRQGGPRLADVLRPIETILKERRFVDDPDIVKNGAGLETRDNQLAVGWARWVFPGAGLELYGEFARNDHPWDFRDLFVEPDQNAGWMLGGAWSWGRPDRTWIVRAETANTRINHLGRIRTPQHMFYRHDSSRQGHTHGGRILGTPSVYGGGGSYVGVDVYEPWGRVGGRWRRELRNDGFMPAEGFPDGSAAPDVIHALTLDGIWFRGAVDWSGELTGAFNLNRYFDDDVFNLRLVLGGRVRL
jgi:O-antigen/teichoic acid export membrane protein